MTRQRPSLPARTPSEISSSSGASFHTAHENRRSMHPGMQARVSDAESSEPSRRSRFGASGLAESARQPHLSGRGDNYSVPRARTARSIPSQANLSDRSLDPRDSVSNQGSDPSNNDDGPRDRSPRRYSNTHRRHEQDGYYGPGRGASNIGDQLDRLRALSQRLRARHGGDPREQYHSSNSPDSYNAESRDPRRQGGRNMSYRHDYSDDEEEAAEEVPPGWYSRSNVEARFAEDCAREDYARELYARGLYRG